MGLILRGISELVAAALLIAAAVVASLLVASIVYPSLGIWQESTISIRLAGVESHYVGTNRIYYITKLYTAPTSPIYVNIVYIVVTNKYSSTISVSPSSVLAGLGSYESWTAVGSVYVLNDAGVCTDTITSRIIESGRSVLITACILSAGGPLPRGAAAMKISCSGCDKPEYYIKI